MRTLNYPSHRQRGVALVMVMIVVAIAMVVVVNIAELSQREIQRVTLTQQQQQLTNYIMASEVLAERILTESFQRLKYDSMPPVWQKQLQQLPTDFGKLSISLEPVDTAFNLNWLVPEAKFTTAPEFYQPYANWLIKILQHHQLDEEWFFTVRDWVTPFSTHARFSDSDYNTLNPPYQMAHWLLHDDSELRLLKGYSTELFELLGKWITVLPKNSHVNINIADEAFLKLIYGDQLQLPAKREFTSVADFKTQTQAGSPKIAEFNETILAVRSEYFLLRTNLEAEGQRLYFSALLHRDDKGKVRVVWRNFVNPLRVLPQLIKKD